MLVLGSWIWCLNQHNTLLTTVLLWPTLSNDQSSETISQSSNNMLSATVHIPSIFFVPSTESNQWSQNSEASSTFEEVIFVKEIK